MRGVFDNRTSRTAPLAEAELTIGVEVVNNVAAMVPGKYINWEGALAFDTDYSSSLESLNKLNNIRVHRYKHDRKYSPVMITEDGHIQGAVMWADIPSEVKQQGEQTTQPVQQGGTRLRVLSNESDNDTVVQKKPEVIETVTDEVNTALTDIEESDRVEKEDDGGDGDVLAEEVDTYDDVEAEGEQGDGTVTSVTVVETIQQSQENPMNVG